MLFTWLQKCIRFYLVRHLILACAVAVSAAIFGAALMTGHSLHEGLRQNVLKRIGPLQHAIYFPEGSVRASVVDGQPDTVAALLVQGELLDREGNVCANKAQIIAVAPRKGFPPLSRPLLNERAQNMIQGTEASIRFKKPTGLSVELPVGDTKSSRMIRRTIHLASTPPGPDETAAPFPLDFALAPATLPPVNIFVPYAQLADALGLSGNANLFVSEKPSFSLPLSTEDFGLEFLSTPTNTTLKSKNIYLPQALTTLFPTNAAARTACFYLADSFEANGLETPYGFVGAVTPSFCGTPATLRDDEVVITAWLANKLQLTLQQSLLLKWRRFEPNGKLVSDERSFRVCAILPTEEAAAFKSFMPLFPGMKDVDSCAAWDVGMPMDEQKLNDKENEAYWKQWRETPKLLMTAAAGESCFGRVFGSAMSLQIDEAPETIRQRVEKSLTAGDAGALTVRLAADGVRAATGSTDFNGLFIGMMFILIISSVLLAALTFSLTLESRKKEIALLLATGWPRLRCLKTFFLEWTPTIMAASIVGVWMGCGLTRLLIWSLARFWRSAFANASLSYYFSLPVALCSSLVMTGIMGAILFVQLRRLTRQTPTTLWQAADERALPDASASVRARHALNIIGSLLALAALAILLASARGEQANAAFFGAGFLLLLSLVLFVRSVATLWRASLRDKSSPIMTGLCRASFMARRNTPVVVLIALGTFLVIGVLSMKHDPAANIANPSSGSGGFASLVTSVIPYDREKGIEMAQRVSGAKIVIPVRVHEGDTAGCLNMNAPIAPHVYGVDAQALARLRAFEPPQAGGVWSPLHLNLTNGCVPALAADLSMLLYSLKAEANPVKGTVYSYTDAKLQLVGVLPVRSSILQGALLIDEQSFLSAFPTDHGYRLWLCDYAPYLLRELTDARNNASTSQRRKLFAVRHPEPGITVETAEERLRLLASVESTYLDMFLVFGGLGMMLGIFGVALIVLRGVEERRHEFAVLLAIGISRKQILFLLLAEYGTLITLGLFIGLIPALIAIQPAAYALKNEMPWKVILGVISLLIASALLSILGSAYSVSRRFSIHALKNN